MKSNGISEYPLLNSIIAILDKYLLVISATFRIARNPYGFGKKIENTPDELRSSFLYFAECYAIFLIVGQFVAPDSSLSRLTAQLPFGSEIVVLALVLFLICLAVPTHYVLQVISGRKRPVYGTISAYAYWYGFITLLVLMLLPSMPILAGRSYINNNAIELIIVLSSLALSLYLCWVLFSLWNWLADVNGSSFWQAVIAYWLVPVGLGLISGLMLHVIGAVFGLNF